MQIQYCPNQNSASQFSKLLVFRLARLILAGGQSYRFISHSIPAKMTFPFSAYQLEASSSLPSCNLMSLCANTVPPCKN
ncbi:hypothetical protein LINPERHAP2_LOCUS30058, partial [Linum perenne]